jgi:hypothetical protein
MTFMDWVAVIGALAWSPSVLKLAKDYFTKPEVRIITQPSTEIGFTTLGSIFNLRMALTVKNRDLVLTGIRLHIKHESGEIREFQWQGIVQKMGQMNYPQVGAVPFEKESSVLAIKVLEQNIDERFIRFQETSFINSKFSLEQLALKKLAFLRQRGEVDYVTFLNGEEMSELYRFIKQSSAWKQGRYTVTFELSSPKRFKVVNNKYEFHLSPVDIEELEGNKNLIEMAYLHEYVPPAAGEIRPTAPWMWRYPALKLSEGKS